MRMACHTYYPYFNKGQWCCVVCFHTFLQNIPKMINRIYVWASRWPFHGREVRENLIQPGNSQPGPVRGVVVLLKYSTFVWMTVQHKWRWSPRNFTYRISLKEVGKTTKNLKNYQEKAHQTMTEPALFTANLICRIHGFMSLTPYSQFECWQQTVGIETNHSMLLISKPLKSILCAL